MAVFILALGPLSLIIVNYGVTFMFVVITLQQMFDVSVNENESIEIHQENTQNDEDSSVNTEEMVKATNSSEDIENECEQTNQGASNINLDECEPCNENKIYNMFKRLREKFSFDEEI